MIENIEKVLDRGEKLDLLVDKTELLQVGVTCYHLIQSSECPEYSPVV